jgi:hypothetical protein
VEEREKYPGASRRVRWNVRPALIPGCETNLNCLRLLRLVKPTTLRSRFAPVKLKDLEDLQLEAILRDACD